MWKGYPCAAFGLLIVLQCALVPAGAAMVREPDIVWDGDTVISGSESYKGTIELRGNLTVTGDLTFTGVELIIDAPDNGVYGIFVENGGSFSVMRGSNIHSWDPDVHFLFQVKSGASLRMDQSELHDCGWDDMDNWTLSPSSDRGLYIESDNVKITNCTITQNCIGIFVDNGASPSICNNTIAKNDCSGIEIWGFSSPVIDGNLIDQNVQNNMYYGAAGIYSESSTPVITNNTVSETVNACGIYISGGDGTVIMHNTVSGHRDPWGYGSTSALLYFGVNATISYNHITQNDNGMMILLGDNTVVGNVVTDNDNEQGGIGIQDQSSSDYARNFISGSAWGLMLSEGSSSMFENDTITNCTTAGLNGYADASPYSDVLTNCTFRNNKRDVDLNPPWDGFYGAGTIELVSPVYDPAKVRVQDGAAVLIVKWPVKVQVVYESDGSPVAGAGVSFKDASGHETTPVETDPDGWTATVLREEYRYNGPVKKALSPYAVTATCGTRVNTTQAAVNKQTDVLVTLHDLPPALDILSPGNGTLTNQTSIKISGRTEPGATLRVDGTAAELDPEGNWKAFVALENEGANEISVESWDAMLNKAVVSWVVFRDTITPVIKLDAPTENALFNTTSAVFSGSVNDPAASLALNGAPVAVGPDGAFSVTVSLEEGRNTAELSCRDAAGNTAVLVRHVTSDTIAPLLRLDSPADGAATNASSVIATGAVESGAELTVNGQKASAAGTGFQWTLELSEGQNSFVFRARDRAGNENSTTISVLRDSTAPAIVIAAPAEGARFNTTGIVLNGTTEPGAAVRVNGVEVTNTGGAFSAGLSLQEGSNTITVEAWDALLNHAGRTVTVFVDSLPPQLKVLGPSNGTLTNQTSVVVNGETEPGATVLVAGNPVTVNAQGKFSTVVALGSEGLNSIPVVARDALNNSASASVSVRRDTVVGFNLSGPADGLKVKARNVTVSGKAEPGATVVIGNVTVPLGADGSFGLSVPLKYGANRIVLRVNDTAGNAESVTLTLTRVKPSTGSGNPLPVEAGFLTVLALLVALGAAGIYAGRNQK
jgi:parallel beta-helix repeat protein